MNPVGIIKRTVIFGLLSMLGTLSYAQEAGDSHVANRADADGLRQGFWKITGAMSGEAGYRPERIVEEGEFKDNKRNGMWTKFYPTGVKRSEITYKNGYPHGPYRIFYPSGTLEEEGDWQNMRNVNAFKRYHENGQIAQDFHFNNKGRRDGTQRYFYASGKPQLTVEVVNGLSHGLYQTFYADGSPREEKLIVEGRVDPESVVHFPQPRGKFVSVPDPALPPGEIMEDEDAALAEKVDSPTEMKVEKYEKTGVDKLFNLDNRISQEGEFREGRLWNGKWYRYDRSGKLSKTEVYKDGKFVGYELSEANLGE